MSLTEIDRFVILGLPPSQKNDLKIRRSRIGQLFIGHSNALTSWRRSAIWQLREQLEGRCHHGPVGLSLTFFVGAGQRTDLDNLIAAPLDALQSAGVIKNDYWIFDLHARRKRDHDNPRVEGILYV